MIAPDAHLRVYVATRPIDFRKGHDGLAEMAMGDESAALRADNADDNPDTLLLIVDALRQNSANFGVGWKARVR